jgi:hypothetical protein
MPCLVEISHRASARGVREYDTVGHGSGGDEFFLLIRGVELDCGI